MAVNKDGDQVSTLTITESTETSDDHIEEGTDLGAIRIHNNVISVIARLSALKVPGVVEMSKTLVDGLAGMIGKKVVDRGIRVDLEENTVVIELHVVLEYGVRIPHVAWQLQNDVRKAVEEMTGKHVRSVNIIVQSVRVQGEPSEDEGDH